MTRLGYETFYAQGGDVGSSVSTWLAALYPERVKALHLNYILGNLQPSLEQPALLAEQLQAFFGQWKHDTSENDPML